MVDEYQLDLSGHRTSRCTLSLVASRICAVSMDRYPKFAHMASYVKDNAGLTILEKAR